MLKIVSRIPLTSRPTSTGHPVPVTGRPVPVTGRPVPVTGRPVNLIWNVRHIE